MTTPVQVGTGPRGATGATGATGPNSVSTSTSTSFTTLIAGNGTNLVSVASVDISNGYLRDSGLVVSVDWRSRTLNDADGQVSYNWATRSFYDSTGITVSINHTDRLLKNSVGANALDWSSAVAGTLTAFAGVTISANTLTIGTGSGTVSQTSFAANTFPARASTGNLVAKTITDFGLSLVDDSSAADARTTLGVGTGDNPQFTGVNLGHATDTTLSRRAAGIPEVESSMLLHLDQSIVRPWISGDFINVANPFSARTVSTGTFVIQASVADHPGVMRAVSHATNANSGGGFHCDTNEATFSGFGGGEEAIIIFRPVTLASLTLRAGFIDTTSSSDCVDGAYLEIVTGTTAAFKTASNSSRTTTNFAATLVNNTWYKIKIVATSDSSISCSLYDGTTLLETITHTTNIPGSGRLFTFGALATGPAGTVNLCDFDYGGFGITGRTLAR